MSSDGIMSNFPTGVDTEVCGSEVWVNRSFWTSSAHLLFLFSLRPTSIPSHTHPTPGVPKVVWVFFNFDLTRRGGNLFVECLLLV